MSSTVTSQTMLFSAAQGTRLRPLGRLSSEQEWPVGSMMDEILAFTRAQWIKLLITACLASLLEPCLQDNPCVLRLLTKVPQGQTWGSHKLALSFTPIVTLKRHSQDDGHRMKLVVHITYYHCLQQWAYELDCAISDWEANKVANEGSVK